MDRNKFLAFILCFSPTGLALAQSAETASTPLSSEGRLMKLINTNQDKSEASDEDRDRQIAKIYRDYARYLEVDANRDRRRADDMFHQIVGELRTLTDQQGIAESMRFRSLYRTILRESEFNYSGSDSTLFNENDEIFQMRAEIFADLDSKSDEPLLENFSTNNKLNMMASSTEFPMDLEAPVIRTIQSMAKRKDHFMKVRQRADLYFPMIERILREEGVPEELKYLAVIESALNPTAASWAKAVGLWQFIPATGGGYGLDISNYVDERKDPEKATRAAARHLRDLHERFGDWQLALAGYNCNPARIERVRRQVSERIGRTANYWDIMAYIPKETRAYVPMFISTYYIMNNPQQFDLGPYQPGPNYNYDVVAVVGGTSLETIASKINPDGVETTINFLRALNPELKKNQVPPTPTSSILPDQIVMSQSTEGYTGGYMLRIPQGKADVLGDLALSKPISVAYESRNTSSRNLASNTTSARGLEELQGILGARSVAPTRSTRSTRTQPPSQPPSVVKPVIDAATTATNPNVVSSTTVAPKPDGTNVTPEVTAPVVVPTHEPATNVAAAEPRTRPTRAERVAAPAPRETTQATRAVASNGRKQTHSVTSGQTLRQIANDYKVSIADIKEWNGIRGDQINRGQRLTIYSNFTPAPAAPAPRVAAPAPRTTSPVSGRGSVNVITRTVRRGETLSSIARENGLTLQELKTLNGLTSNVAPIGRALKVKGAAPAAASSRGSRSSRSGRAATTVAPTRRNQRTEAPRNTRTEDKKKVKKTETPRRRR